MHVLLDSLIRESNFYIDNTAKSPSYRVNKFSEAFFGPTKCLMEIKTYFINENS